MPKSIDDFRNIANDLIARDIARGRDDLYEAMGNMRHNKWDKPESLSSEKFKWIIPHIDPSPRNSIVAGKRAYATMAPNPHILRPGSKTEDRERFEKLESVARYQFMGASQRQLHMNGSSTVEQMLDYSMTYGTVAVQVVHVEAQLARMGKISNNRKRAIRNYGDYIINVHHPSTIRTRMSEMGLNGVLLTKIMTIPEFKAFWGSAGKPVLKYADAKKNTDNKYICVYEWTDYENRAAWASYQSSPIIETIENASTIESALGGIEMFIEDQEFDYLPWAIASDADPLLIAVHETGAWDNKNLKDTLLASEVIIHAAGPRYKFESPTGEIDFSYGEPEKFAHIKPGEKLEPMEPPVMDQNLAILADRDADRIRQSTAPNVVTSLEAGANEAGYSFNQRLQSGLATFATHKRQVEAVLGEVFCHMLYSSKAYGKPMSGPSYDKLKKEYAYDEAPITIDPDTYGYDLKFNVELKPDTMVDRTQQLQSAVLLVRDLGVSLERALEMLGEEDPHEVVKQSIQENLQNVKVQGRIQTIQAEDQLKAQATLAGLQSLVTMAQDPNFAPMLQQMAQQVMQQQQQQAAPTGEGTPTNPMNSQGIVGMEGQQYQSNAAAFSPGAGSEAVATGNDTSGAPLE